MASQSADFWNQVGTSDSDIEHLYGFLLERGTPLSSRELATNLIAWRVREEERHLAELAARRSPVYQPKNTFEVGSTVIFTALGNREGIVNGLRPGDNPRLGNFQVIQVQFPGEPKPREFAAAYSAPHPLNEEITQKAISLGVTPEQAVERYGESVRQALIARLQSDKEFAHIGDQWFLRGMLPEINPGYLNLAEAAIEQAADALSTAELARILELPQTGKKAAIDFALNLVLGSDPRFEDVGPLGESRWILVRMELPEARERPPILEVQPTRTVRLPAELEMIANDLFDSADASGVVGKPTPPASDEVTFVLTYPHRRAGSLPLIPPLRALLPEFDRPRLKVNIVDAETNDKFPGYVLGEGNYLVGLQNWYSQRKLSPGAYVSVRRGADRFTLAVSYQYQRERSLWVRTSRVSGTRLTFTLERRPLSHKYDEEMLIVIADPLGLDAIGDIAREQRSLTTLLEDIFPELAKLVPGGRVHAKTLYSAVNLLRRTPPRAALSAIVESRAFTSVGGGYFVLNEVAR